MERVLAYYAGDFPEDEQEYVAVMRLLVEHPAAALVAAELEAVPLVVTYCHGLGELVDCGAQLATRLWS